MPVSDADRLQSFLRKAAAAGREAARVPPFTAFFHPSEKLTFLNYAIADRAAAPSAAAVAELRRAFLARERVPRLEWLEEAAPRLAPALAAAGMREELCTPFMACAPTELLAPRPALDVAAAAVTDADVRELVDLQRVAFGQEPLAPDAQPPDPRRFGGGAVLARVSGEPVAAASWTNVIDGVSEIIGVATAAAWRRRGLGGLVTAAAASNAFAAGAELCVLSPGGETAQRVYAHAGFRRVATMLHWVDPD
jgi:GNAT superfamily N-acetyltransferase